MRDVLDSTVMLHGFQVILSVEIYTVTVSITLAVGSVFSAQISLFDL